METVRTEQAAGSLDMGSQSRSWQFRREITLGAVVQLIVLAGMVIAGWSNLQKELALIRRELTLLSERSIQIQQHMEKLDTQCREQEYRIRMIEKANPKG